MKLERMVILTGIDGSGKTQHARMLASNYLRSGIKCDYVWMRTAYFFSFPFMVLCRALGFSVIHKLPSGRTVTEHKYRAKPIAIIWPWIQFVDLFIYLTAKVYIPILRGYLLVADRFVLDILVDLMVDVNNPHLYRSFVGQLMLKLVPERTISFLFDVDEQTALKRKSDIPNSEYLVVRRRYYRSTAHHLEIRTIDSLSTFRIVHERLLRKVKEYRSALAAEHIEKQLCHRLQARARWKKWKKGPVAILKRLSKRVLHALMNVLLGGKGTRSSSDELSTDTERFRGNLGYRINSYMRLLKRRGLDLHTLVVVGSGAKNRWSSKSDLDVIVIASGFPGGFRSRFSKHTVLSDFPLFLGVEAYGCTKEGFLKKVENLKLLALDAFYCGKILFDDGFWHEVEREFKVIEDEYNLEKEELESKLSWI